MDTSLVIAVLAAAICGAILAAIGMAALRRGRNNNGDALIGQLAGRIAQLADIHPTTLSKLMNGIEVPKPDDPRVLAVGRVLGLKKDEVFEKK